MSKYKIRNKKIILECDNCSRTIIEGIITNQRYIFIQCYCDTCYMIDLPIGLCKKVSLKYLQETYKLNS